VEPTAVKPVLVGGPGDAQHLAPSEVGRDEQEIRLGIGGTTFIWIRGEPIDDTGPVVKQYFRLIAMSRLHDAEAPARPT
jgi:hypothetical protein